MKHLGERRVVAMIRRSFSQERRDVLLGIGDDAALVRTPRLLLLTTDILVEDEDFRLPDHPARLLGRKALNVNLSDVAAMGGRPLHALVGLALPGSIEADWLRAFMGGFRSAAREAGVALVGGDLSGAEKVLISVTVTGPGALPGEAERGPAGRRDLRLRDARATPPAACASSRRAAAAGWSRPSGRCSKAFLDPAPRLELGALSGRAEAGRRR
ncbi:MAG: AIR synthase related protein [Candidatus Moduliflexus flocculans]|nr:AIR synthase related protein [Candidatus Moduliflexus flocculans]